MSVTQLTPPAPKFVRVEAEISQSQRAEDHQAMIEICAGRRPRLDALEQQVDMIKARALSGLQRIEHVAGDN